MAAPAPPPPPWSRAPRALPSFPTRRSSDLRQDQDESSTHRERPGDAPRQRSQTGRRASRADRKSTRLNSSHSQISYAVFRSKKKTPPAPPPPTGRPAAALRARPVLAGGAAP